MDWSFSLQCGWIGLHFLGLATVWMVRIHAGMKSEGLAHAMFLASFCSIVLATLVGLKCNSTNWTFSAGILAIMIVAAVFDFSSPKEHTMQLEFVHNRD
ncbi:MAG: hypothetical protein ABGX16_14580 [Pirellulales bacterium]